MAGKPEETSCIEGRTKHCLHHSDHLHAVYHGPFAVHRDDYCCFCGQRFCYAEQMIDPSKHGPHL